MDFTTSELQNPAEAPKMLDGAPPQLTFGFTLEQSGKSHYPRNKMTVTDPRFTTLSPAVQEKTLAQFRSLLQRLGFPLVTDASEHTTEPGVVYLRLPMPPVPLEETMRNIQPLLDQVVQDAVKEELGRKQLEERKTAIEALKRDAAKIKTHYKAVWEGVKLAVQTPEGNNASPGHWAQQEEGRQKGAKKPMGDTAMCR